MNNKLIIIFLVVFAGVMGGGCATLPKQPSISSTQEMYLKDICQQNNIRWEWDQVSQVVTLKYRNAKAQALIGSELVLIGADRIFLSSPMRRVRSAVIVPKDFKGKVVNRLRQKAASQKGYQVPKVRKVMIDAGHGGKDPGAIGRTGTKEKVIVLDVAKRLKKLLKEKGFKVEMTRSDDTFISLEGRTEIASRANVDLFVSIHANSSPVRSVYGIEVYSARNLSFIDKIASQRKTNESLLFRNLKIKRSSQSARKIVSDMLYTHKQAESKRLAEYLAKKSSQMAKTKNRGAKTARFYVLRNTLIPAILVEVGFLSNPKEERMLKTSSYRQKIARSLAESIVGYANGR